MNGKTYLKKLDINQQNTDLKKITEKLLKDLLLYEKQISNINLIIVKWKKEIDTLKNNEMFNRSEKSIQSICVIREHIEELESALSSQNGKDKN